MENNPDSLLAEEVREWNTPLLSAYLLWEFTSGYKETHPENASPVGILHFIALALLTNPNLCRFVSNRRSSLQSYALGIEENKLTDQLLSLQERISQRKLHTLAAIDAAIKAGLLVWDSETAIIHPVEIIKKPNHGKNLKATVKSFGAKARILGGWFSSHDTFAIANYLRVTL
ncbi:three component ABC system middle component [Pseudomonas sp. LB3P14]